MPQACLESMWLQAGPVLLSLFRAACGEASAADAKAPGPKLDLRGNPGPPLFAMFGEALMHTLIWAGEPRMGKGAIHVVVPTRVALCKAQQVPTTVLRPVVVSRQADMPSMFTTRRHGA